MKRLLTSVFTLLAAGTLFITGCHKEPFKSETGLYSIKQYHTYAINAPGDTTKLADVKISITSLDNNYLSWNNITFHVYTSNDSLVTYVKDSSVNGTYRVMYTLWYMPKTDHIDVFDNFNNDKLWRSF